MIDLWSHLKTVVKPILIYGTGNGADKIINELNRRGISVSGVFASNGFVRERTFRGFRVLSFADAKASFGDFVVLVSFGTQRSDVISYIKCISEQYETYAPDVPVADEEGVFDCEFARAHRNDIEKAYGLLSDDISRAVFKNIILFKLTGDISLLFDCESEKSEAADILEISAGEIFLDIGAYNGDTVLQFTENCPEYKKIYAVEPDIKNFKKLLKNTEGMRDTICLNKTVGKNNCRTTFKMTSGRNSHLSDDGRLIDQVCIDELFPDGGVSYIKIDVEGAEESVILGGIKTIENFGPKLNIAAYHRNSDIFNIPILIKNIRQDYEVYLRHNPYIPAWDTIYYFK